MAIFTSKLLVYQRVTIIPSEVIHFGRATFAHIAWKSPVTPSCCASFSRLGFTGQILPPKGGVWTFFVQVFFSWLVVLTILKNISQWEGFSHILWKIKNVPNHQPVSVFSQLLEVRVFEVGGLKLLFLISGIRFMVETYWCDHPICGISWLTNGFGGALVLRSQTNPTSGVWGMRNKVWILRTFRNLQPMMIWQS